MGKKSISSDLSYEDALRNYEAKRTEYFLQFERASRKLIKQIIKILPDLHRNSRENLAQLAEFERIKEYSIQDFEAATTVQWLFQGIRSKQTARVDGKKMSMEVEGKNLVLQLNTIKIAAVNYTITHDDDERMRFEHTLVRSGADLRDIIYDRLGNFDLKFLHKTCYKGLKKFCWIYEEILMAYDTMTKLHKPKKN